ncbi:MAG TPA: ATP-binding protein [Ktedonobacteraceae bacterium]|nr:ATP-binding protein [Ktedonobacteraceae bacterium]
MKRNSFVRWPWQRQRRHLVQDASAALFRGIRIRLTLWYCGVLGTALILFGVALYFGTQYFLLTPIESDAAAQAQGHVHQFLADQIDHGCPSYTSPGQFGPPSQNYQMSVLFACFDQNGSLLPNENTAGLPSAFLSNTVVKTALQTGQAASDIIYTGSTYGQVYRYALVVSTGGSSGVILIGESVQAQESALSLLLYLLLALGGLALLGAGLGGLFLSNRALAPARLSWSNQQRFISDAAHELRTPLTLLRADAEVLLRGRKRLVEEDAELLEDIVAETSHMSKLTSNLLMLARLDAGASHREHDVVNLVELSQKAARRVQAFAEQRGITVQVQAADDLYVIGDQSLLEQAALGLLDNAIKYNQQGGHITVRALAQNQRAQIEVRDTGIGIAAEHLPHLGERFYRVDKARSREAGGTGLGISIARSIAAAHNGTLILSSIPGQGTTATLSLPLAHLTALDQRNVAPGSMASLSEQKQK